MRTLCLALAALALSCAGAERKLEEKFDGPTRWRAEAGSWQQADGVLRQGGPAEALATIKAEAVSNASVQARVRLPKGVVEGYVGIVFGLDGQGKGFCVYLAIHRRSNRDNLVKLREIDRGRVGSGNLVWVKSPLEGGKWYDLRIDAAGHRVRVALDGKRLFTHTVGRDTAGRLGLWTFQSAAEFDDLRVGPSAFAPRGAGRPKRFARVNSVFPSPVRQRLVLDGEWQFRMDPGDAGQEAGWAKGSVAFPDRIRVPGAWEAQGFGGEKTVLRYQGTPVHLRGSYHGPAWYRRTIEVPAAWKGKRVWLKLGGVQPSAAVWCNGAYLGFHARYFEPFKFDVTDLVKPGEACTVVARIDNREQASSFGQGGGAGGCLTIVWPWGGIHRSVELEATAAVSIQRATLVPDLDTGKVEVRVELEDEPPPAAKLALQAEARLLGEGAATSFGKAAVPVRGKTLSLTVPVAKAAAWSPESPRLYRLDLRLADGGKAVDVWSERFGFCKREVRGNDVFLNNRQVFLRGYGNDCVYPLTIAPPASRDIYRERFKLARDYGFVYVRHHTWVPLPEYFDAADELGIMLQPELPYGGPTGRLDALIANYRNHPSLAVYSMTNEANRGKASLSTLYHHAKAQDPTRFAIDSDGCSGPVRPTADLWLISGTPPDSHPAFKTKPVLYHEFLNLPTIVDPAALPKFTGGLKPVAMANLAAYAKAKGRQTEVREAVRASRYLQKLLQKDGIERARRQGELDGYCYWTIADFWEFGQGLFDMLWQPRAWTAVEFRRFNDRACVLAELPGHTFWQGGKVEAKLLVSNYTGADIRSAEVAWTLSDGEAILAKGRLTEQSAAQGAVTRLGSVALDLPELRRHAKLVLRCTLTWPEGALENEWELWTFSRAALTSDFPATVRFRGRAKGLAAAYPDLKPKAERELIVAESLDPADADFLRRGGRLLLTSTSTFGGERVRLHPGWWRPSPSNQVGLAMGEHPALAGFPHDGAAGFQLGGILRTVVDIDGLPFKATPIIYGLSYPFPRLPASQKKLGGEPPTLRACLFEFAVGKGMVLVSGLDLSGGRPESRALLDGLLRYATSPECQPKGEGGAAALRLFTPSIDQLSLAKRVRPDKVRPGAAATVELRVANAGALPCEATVADTLPAGLETLDPLTWTVSVRGREERVLWYRVRAARPGGYALPPAKLSLGGRDRLSKPATLTVAADAPPPRLPRTPEPNAASVVARWALDEGRGDSARDAGGRHALALRDVAWSYGAAGTALRFNGTTSTASARPHDGLSLPGPLGIALWAWPARLTSAEQCLIDKGGSGRRNYGIYLVGSDVVFIVHAKGEEHQFRTRRLRLKPRQWAHIVCSYDRKQVRIAVNGRLRLAEKAALGDLTPTKTPLFLGTRGPQNDLRFEGLLDDVTILRTAR